MVRTRVNGIFGADLLQPLHPPRGEDCIGQRQREAGSNPSSSVKNGSTPEWLGIMKKQLVRISVLQSSKITTALYVLMGLIYTVIGIPMSIYGHGPFRVMGIVYIAMPAILGVVGFVFFVVFAALYNSLAKILGGIEVEVTDNQ